MTHLRHRPAFHVAVAKPSFSPIEVLVWADAIPSLGDREAPSITRGLELLLLNSGRA
jgi:hypothetical protein